VVDECERVRQAVDFLQQDNADAFGKLMFDCHASLRDYFEVSIPELDTLVEIAAAQPGCLGARLTGAGFGGCTVNLVRTESVDEFICNLSSQYHAITGKDAKVYVCQAADGAAVITRE
jgi:galactokinase